MTAKAAVTGRRAPFSVGDIRKQFPILAKTYDNKRLVYLDNAASTQKPAAVIDCLARMYRESYANVHRGAYRLSNEATDLYEKAREKTRLFLGAASIEEIIFTRGATESLNLIAFAWGRYTLKPGDEVVLTEMEHHSNIVPWQLLCRDTGASLKYIPIEDDGGLDMNKVKSTITPRAKLVSVTHMSNVLGTINPVAEIAAVAHERGALVAVDGAQGAPHLPLDVRAIDCDFYALSGHKMCGPTGIGALYVRRDVLKNMEPFHGGGDMIRQVFLDRATWNDLPYKYEAGTPNFVDGVAFGAAIDFLNGLGMEQVRAHEIELTGYALQALEAVPGLTVYGPRDVQSRGGVVSFNIDGVHPHDVATIVDDHAAVAIRAGHHCAQPLMKRLDVAATARASFYVYNDRDDVDALVDGVLHAKKIFGV